MDVFGAAVSGMQAAQARLMVGADNLANLETPGFKASRVDLVEGPGGGVQVAGIEKDNSPGPINSHGQERSNVDPTSEMVGILRARALYTANAMVVRAADQMIGTLLDMMDSHRT